MTFLSVSGLCAYDNPVNSLEINLADIIEERFKRDMVVSCFDILFQIINPPFLGTARNGHAHPYVLVVRGETDFVRALRQKDIGVLGIAADPLENFCVPFRLPIGEIAHSCHEPHMRTGRIDDAQFSFHVFRHGKVVGNVETAAVVTGIAVRASYSAPYHYVHVFIRDLMQTLITQLFLRPPG